MSKKTIFRFGADGTPSCVPTTAGPTAVGSVASFTTSTLYSPSHASELPCALGGDGGSLVRDVNAELMRSLYPSCLLDDILDDAHFTDCASGQKRSNGASGFRPKVDAGIIDLGTGQGDKGEGVKSCEEWTANGGIFTQQLRREYLRSH